MSAVDERNEDLAGVGKECVLLMNLTMDDPLFYLSAAMKSTAA